MIVSILTFIKVVVDYLSVYKQGLNTSSRSWRDNREKNDQIASLNMQRLSKVIYDITLSP
jgi:hypothetical protein